MSIKINPKNKGKFTASAKAAGHSVQEHAKSVLSNPNASPLQKKRANFARNAAKWKHQDGGKMAKDSVDNNIMLRQLYRESRFKEKAVSPANAKGLAQLRPITVDELKKKGVNVNPMNPKDAIKAHKTLMTDLNNTPWIKKENQHPDVTLLKILGGYNMGRTGLINLLNKLKASGKDIYNDPKIISHFPKETQDYFTDISGKNPAFEKEFQGAVEKFKYKGAYPTKKAHGGIIKDNRGQWAHPGKPTQIQGGDITMKGVNFPVLGVSDTGERRLMKPGEEHKFQGAKHVNEFPMMRKGGAFSMGSTMNPRTGDANYFFRYSFAPIKQPKVMSRNSAANLGNAYTQELINKLKTFKFKSGGAMLGSKPNPKDALKRGVDLGFDKLYPLPFKKGGKMQKGGQIQQDATRVNTPVRPLRKVREFIPNEQWDIARKAASDPFSRARGEWQYMPNGSRSSLAAGLERDMYNQEQVLHNEYKKKYPISEKEAMNQSYRYFMGKAKTIPYKELQEKILYPRLDSVENAAIKKKMDWFKSRGVDLNKEHVKGSSPASYPDYVGFGSNQVEPHIYPGSDVMYGAQPKHPRYQLGGTITAAKRINYQPGFRRTGDSTLVTAKTPNLEQINPAAFRKLTDNTIKGQKVDELYIGDVENPEGGIIPDAILSGTKFSRSQGLNPYGQVASYNSQGQRPAFEPKPPYKKPMMEDGGKFKKASTFPTDHGGVVWGTNDQHLKSALKLAMGGKIMNKHLNDHVDPRKTIVKTKHIIK